MKQAHADGQAAYREPPATSSGVPAMDDSEPSIFDVDHSESNVAPSKSDVDRSEFNVEGSNSDVDRPIFDVDGSTFNVAGAP